ncbi:Hypp160 [Branchiostoma lanceolatum]|uniref:Hypp160 protein n=1 Tax=Branchiostoma lanceolatum TaxID=7740 RepID=A0A8J9YHV1_BRALA|nr:Hypp160 [Branchiostoma lanceolatum]
MADHDDVPPLEDMSELVERINTISEFKGKKTTVGDSKGWRVDGAGSREGKNLPTASNPPSSKVIAGQDSSDGKGDSQVSSSASSQSGTKKETFGGMKKGFLFGSGAKPKKKPVSKPAEKKTEAQHVESIPVIKPKEPQSTGLELPEVQAAMKTASEQLQKNTDWVTEDLLKKIQSSSSLTSKMEDPRFQQALAKFQRNPALAMQEYGDNPEVQKFFTEFCSILGDHFTKIADKQDSVQPPPVQTTTDPTGADMRVLKSTDPNQPTAEDEAKMKEILSNPEMQQVLLDKDVQKLLEMLRTDPESAQRYAQSAGPDMQKKIRKLVEAGLVSFQR